MSEETRPVPTRLTICDLCGEPIPETSSGDEVGRLLGRTIYNPVTEGKTKRVRWHWKNVPADPKARPVYENFDFHGDCIASLVREAVAARLRGTVGA